MKQLFTLLIFFFAFNISNAQCLICTDGVDYGCIQGVNAAQANDAKCISEFGAGWTMSQYSVDDCILNNHCDGVTTPVELTYFEARQQQNTILLTWVTASELNNSHFEIERSSDGIYFTSIKSINGHGSTDVEITYNLIDYEPLNGVNYYRLKQVDYDGDFEYSEVVSVEFIAFKTVITPNISNGLFYVNKVGRVAIFNTVGQLVKELNLMEPSNIDLSNFPDGIYYVQLEDHVEKIITVK